MSEVPPPAQFTAPGRNMAEEDRIRLTSVGVDIGSSTSHLIFSRLELERQDNRYVTVSREVLHESDILLTPYIDEATINGDALGQFVDQEYAQAGLRREDVDTGALILTGVALDRHNARAIGELFSHEAGRFVAVSAGDNLEATMAAHGSGAIALSAEGSQTVLNVDVGGGTTKIVVCVGGKAGELAALDVGARLVVSDGGVITRLEDAGRRIGQAVGLDLALGGPVDDSGLRAMAGYMADQLYLAVGGVDGTTSPLMRTPPLSNRAKADALTFSGGVSEFVYGRENRSFGDLGALLAEEIRARLPSWGIPVLEPAAGIRATVIGASQYTIQVSGSTIYLSPLDVVPLRNVPVIAPAFHFGEDEIDAAAAERATRAALGRFDLAGAGTAVAIAFHWEGSATFSRLNSFCQAAVAGMQASLDAGHPLILVCDGDIGGLLGVHIREELHQAVPIVSIDGIDLREFDYIDIGSLIPASGAVPVVIKSLIFPDSQS
ncbi:MAG TPA: ethanolamine ammonia-lyase reactivating factor EutA [Dehalococcoidia bacterium]|nr:ethanolamine ammonia-lyase reactivating factor EutA [Dehalococcoidia bacterium]